MDMVERAVVALTDDQPGLCKAFAEMLIGQE